MSDVTLTTPLLGVVYKRRLELAIAYLYIEFDTLALAVYEIFFL